MFRVAGADLREIWVGQSQELCVANCAELRAAEIPYQVIQHGSLHFKDMEGNFRIGVAPEFYDEARKIIDGDNLGASEDPDSNPEVEVRAGHDKAPSEADDQYRDWQDEGPDNARVEVASENDREFAGMIVLALRENDIESRTTVLPDGCRKIFVTLGDELRAREIIREIQTETPPE
jgi:hypothetical protein